MIASLAMYDRAETAAANDRYWQAIRARLGFGPDSLSRGGDLWQHWLSPDLVLSQTCGYPYRARLHGRVTLVGTPDYGLEDCPPGHYRSVFVVRGDDPRDDLAAFAADRFAYNEAMSQSGWAAPQTHAARLGFAFENLRPSGGHRFSARMVAEGQADIASLDALTWEILQQHDSFANDLRVIAHTDPTPVLPYITARGREADVILAAIAGAIADLSAQDRALLHLKGVVSIPAEDYLSVPTPPAPPPI